MNHQFSQLYLTYYCGLDLIGSWYVSDLALINPYFYLKNIFIINPNLREDICGVCCLVGIVALDTIVNKNNTLAHGECVMVLCQKQKNDIYIYIQVYLMDIRDNVLNQPPLLKGLHKNSLRNVHFGESYQNPQLQNYESLYTKTNKYFLKIMSHNTIKRLNRARGNLNMKKRKWLR